LEDILPKTQLQKKVVRTELYQYSVNKDLLNKSVERKIEHCGSVCSSSCKTKYLSK